MSVTFERSTQIRPAEDERDAVPLLGKAPLRCAGCGYEIRSYRVLPQCPMCRELHWEPAPWRPFTTPHSA